MAETKPPEVKVTPVPVAPAQEFQAQPQMVPMERILAQLGKEYVQRSLAEEAAQALNMRIMALSQALEKTTKELSAAKSEIAALENNAKQPPDPETQPLAQQASSN